MSKYNMLQLIISFLSGGTIVALVNHILYKSKLDKEGKAKIQDNIRSDIYFNLIKYKELIEDLNSNEIMFYEELIEDQNLDFFDYQPISPTILIDMNHVDNYYDKIYSMRSQYLNKLSEPLAATLYCLERYFLNLKKYLLSLRQNQYSIVGSIIINDFREFYKTISTLIYKEIDKKRSEFLKYNEKQWEQMKGKYMEELWINSRLYALMFPETLSNTDHDQILFNVSKALKEGVGNMSTESNESVKNVQKILNNISK